MIPFNIQVPLNDIDNNFENCVLTTKFLFLSQQQIFTCNLLIFSHSSPSQVQFPKLSAFSLLCTYFAAGFIWGNNACTIPHREQIIQYTSAYHMKTNCIFVFLYVQGNSSKNETKISASNQISQIKFGTDQ